MLATVGDLLVDGRMRDNRVGDFLVVEPDDRGSDGFWGVVEMP